MPTSSKPARKPRPPRKPRAAAPPEPQAPTPPADPSLGLDLALSEGQTAFDALSANRTLVVLRGLPGSGCDAVVRGLMAQAELSGRKEELSVATVFEAFRVPGGDSEQPEYKFDASKIPSALADVNIHFCSVARDAMVHDDLLDPEDELYTAEPATNVRLFVMLWINAEPYEFLPLTQVAALSGWDVHTFASLVSDIRDIAMCRARTKHLVEYPDGYLEKQALRLLGTDTDAQADYKRVLDARTGKPADDVPAEVSEPPQA